MSAYYYTILVVFFVIAAMIIIDNNVAIYITLIGKILKVNFERIIWMIRFHPNNFITTWIQNRKYDKIARDLEKEFMNKENSHTN
jgi:hypothetical protein